MLSINNFIQIPNQNKFYGNKCRYAFNVKLSTLTWLKVGGVASVIFYPQDLDDLKQFFYFYRGEVIILGSGSNIIFADRNFDREVIVKLNRGFTNFNIQNNLIFAQAQVLDFKLAQLALQHKLGGLEFLSGIPGTLGGNIAMNAGCYGSEIKHIINNFTVFNHITQNITVKTAQNFTYRSGNLEAGDVVISAQLIGTPMENDEPILKKMQNIHNNRKLSQPQNIATCGSTFKNLKHIKAWEALKNSGAHNLQVGDAVFSKVHCNFLQNLGKAQAIDFFTLIDKAKETVFEKLNINLETEVLLYR